MNASPQNRTLILPPSNLQDLPFGVNLDEGTGNLTLDNKNNRT